MAVTASEAHFAKTLTWCIRLLQLAFSIVLLGSLSYIINEHREFVRPGPYSRFIPYEVIVPEVFSIFSIPITLFGVFAVFFFSFSIQIVAACLDLVLFIGWIACIGLLRNNFHTDGRPNQLARYLNGLRRSHGARGHQALNGHLVRLIVALVIIQIILFFVTGMLAMLVAVNDRRKKAAAKVAPAPVMVLDDGRMHGVAEDEKVREFWKGRDSSETAVA
ncbi:uncharacterized protein LAJ45_10606 [Morchella importuna]|uniref:uncharacterized protein n=1 Tax=Morchella importuna TaxID=1174673 RepID=UPI001E8E79BE|nr:uncharacterized protein LAJ45_10606 [Morchella importuna]KAH8145326.1 hypothetical protein LAJ45_10606 [Morchella importuna]